MLVCILIMCYYICISLIFCVCLFFKQKTAYEMRISDWSSDVCSSDLRHHRGHGVGADVLQRRQRVADRGRAVPRTLPGHLDAEVRLRAVDVGRQQDRKSVV